MQLSAPNNDSQATFTEIMVHTALGNTHAMQPPFSSVQLWVFIFNEIAQVLARCIQNSDFRVKVVSLKEVQNEDENYVIVLEEA